MDTSKANQSPSSSSAGPTHPSSAETAPPTQKNVEATPKPDTPPPEPPEDPVDDQAFQQFVAMMNSVDSSMIRELVNIFKDDVPVKVVQLRQQKADNDTATFHRTAHSLKSSAAQMGGIYLSSICRQLEMMGKEDNIAGSEEIIAELEKEYNRFIEALEERLRLLSI